MPTKRMGLSVILAVLICSLSGCANQPESQAGQQAVDNGPAEVSWFTAESVADGVWRIDDHGGDNMYLVEGTDQALLIDTGLGICDLAAFVQSLTDKPLVLQDGLDFDSTVLDPIEAGARIDLGGRSLEVIETPGHTPGSICLLDAGNKLLFAGDTSNIPVWLFLDVSLPLDVYLQSLQRLEARAGEFDTIFPGHRTPLDPPFLTELTTCVQNILDGTCKGEPYTSFAGDALQCSCERATVAFDPNKLHPGM
ncbi:MAG: MBL fold metallo-hydrolase [Acidobacteriota bacterium]